jgi:hypothetical protein
VRLHCEMVNVGFERLDADHSIYVRRSKSGNAIVGVHVDNMVATATDLTMLNTVICNLQKVLEIIDMGPIKWFLGIKVIRNRKKAQFHSPKLHTLTQS